jgi:small subunit ribosomal protein S2
MSAQLGAAGVDLGSMEEAVAEEALVEATAEDAPAAEA